MHTETSNTEKLIQMDIIEIEQFFMDVFHWKVKAEHLASEYMYVAHTDQTQLMGTEYRLINRNYRILSVATRGDRIDIYFYDPAAYPNMTPEM